MRKIVLQCIFIRKYLDINIFYPKTSQKLWENLVKYQLITRVRISGNLVGYPRTRLPGKWPGSRVPDTRLGNPIKKFKFFKVSSKRDFTKISKVSNRKIWFEIYLFSIICWRRVNDSILAKMTCVNLNLFWGR